MSLSDFVVVLYSYSAIRTGTVFVGAPWKSVTVQRAMPALKFYHDLDIGMPYLCLISTWEGGGGGGCVVVCVCNACVHVCTSSAPPKLAHISKVQKQRY